MKKSKSITGIPYDKCLKILKNLETANANLNKLHELLSEKVCGPLYLAFEHHIEAADIALNGLDHSEIINYYLFERPTSGGFVQHGRKRYKLDTVKDLAKYICRKQKN